MESNAATKTAEETADRRADQDRIPPGPPLVVSRAQRGQNRVFGV